MNKMKIYNQLPNVLQNFICNYQSKKIKNYRYCNDFWGILKKYEERSSFSPSQLIEYRDMQLRKMVKHCYNTVPYYKYLFDNLIIDYKDIKTLNDLKVLPILTKDIVKEKFDLFISSDFRKENLVYTHTNGTTGSGFRFLTTHQAILEQWAVWWRYRNKIGISMKMLCGVFGGKPIVPIRQKHPPFWRSNKALNQLYFSIYHLNKNNIPYYISDLNNFRIKWIHGFPSAIVLLASYMLENNLKLGYEVEFITTGSENLLDHQKEVIEQAFGVCPKQHYGLAEGVANISEDIDNFMYVDEDFAAVEFVEFANEGKHIVGSSLTNFGMPFLRYDTKDIATVETAEGFQQNSRRRIISIDGRKEDYITLKDSTKIGRLAHVFADTTAVKEAQIFQEQSGDIEVRIVKTNMFTSFDEKNITENLREKLGNDVKISIRYMDKIERSSSGKLRFVISEFNNN